MDEIEKLRQAVKDVFGGNIRVNINHDVTVDVRGKGLTIWEDPEGTQELGFIEKRSVQLIIGWPEYNFNGQLVIPVRWAKGQTGFVFWRDTLPQPRPRKVTKSNAWLYADPLVKGDHVTVEKGTEVLVFPTENPDIYEVRLDGKRGGFMRSLNFR